MAIPNVKPGGGSFPVFSGNAQPSAVVMPWDEKETAVLIQFDFSSDNGMQDLTDSFGNLFRAFVVNLSSLFQNRVAPVFNSLLVGIDFDPSCQGSSSPYTPLQVADSSSGQLIYIGDNFYITNPTITSAKTSVCVPYVSRSGSQIMFSKRSDIGGGNPFRGAGSAILTTKSLSPFVIQSQG